MEKILFDEMANFIVRIESILDDNKIDNSDIIYQSNNAENSVFSNHP